jgi:hypothetical protein
LKGLESTAIGPQSDHYGAPLASSWA